MLKYRIMKKKIIYSAIIFLVPVLVQSQDWGGLRPGSFWDHWSVNASAGLTSYFGDVSYYDEDVAGKLSNESGAAYEVLLTKHFNKVFSVSGGLIYGNLKGGNKSFTFTTSLAEYSLQANLDFVRLIFGNRIPKFGIEGHAGLGQFLFQTTRYELKGDTKSKFITETGVPEFAYFYGAGAHYHIGEKFAITADLTLHHAQNDKLDDLVKNNDYDYYSHLSIGITYFIDSFRNTPLKNKARIAHGGIRAN
jgi:hypothetical protein